MSSWAQTTPRTFLNDANRSRFSSSQPTTENHPQSVGPCAYTPNIVRPKIRGQVILHKTQDGVSERQKEIYGVPTSKILPIHALSYEPKAHKGSPFDNIANVGEALQQSFRSRSPRQLWPKTDQTKSPEEYPPGPNSYSLPSPSVTSTTPRAPTVFVPVEPRASNSPVQKEPLPSLNGTLQLQCSMLSSSSVGGGGGYGTSPRNASSRLSPSATAAATSPSKSTLERYLPRATTSPRNAASSGIGGFRSSPAANLNGTLGSPSALGASIGRSPRHLNMHNINSLLPREKDADFNNPSPVAYDVAKQTTSFSPASSKRN